MAQDPVNSVGGQQLALAGLVSDGTELLSIEADKAANRCTAACIEAREALRSLVISSLANGLGTRRVAEAFGVSRESVRALRAKVIKTGELDQMKKAMAGESFALADAAKERLMDELDDIPLASLYMVMRTAFEHGQILSGGVTQRVERRDGASVGEVADYIAGMLNVTPIQPVAAGEISSVKALGPSDASVIDLDWVAQMGGNSVTVDNQSTVSAQVPQLAPNTRAELGQIAPTLPTLSPALAPLAALPAADRAPGAGGVSISQGGADSSTR